jgi:hypothetical protein
MGDNMNETDIFTVMHNSDVVRSLNIALAVGIVICLLLLGIFIMMIKLYRKSNKSD